jgi:hypothetical protein
MSTIRDNFKAGFNDSTVAHALLHPALLNLDQARGSYPTRTTGANPDTAPTRIEYDEHNQPIRDINTATERGALNVDDAERAHRRISKAALAYQRAARDLALALHPWATPTLDSTEIKDRLTAVDEGLWCANHLEHRMHEVRRQGDLCAYCADFRRTRGLLPPVEVLDFRSRHGRISETHTRQLMVVSKDRARAAKQAARKDRGAA